DVPVSFAVDRAELRRTLAPLAERTTLSEAATKQLLEAYGIPGTLPRPASSAEEAVQHARQIGYPVVLKVLSPDISHKSDVGGVALDLRDDGAVRIAYEGILGMARQRQPAALLSGVTVQPMVQAAGGTEMILGTKKDPIFGSVILVGLGGVMAEVYRDRALGLPPLNERLARRMLESLRCWPLLQGYRGRPPVDLDRLIEIMIRFSYLVADCPEIVELDVNPLLVSSREAAALDARAVIEPVAEASRPYAHLALRPYPEEQVRRVTLGDGAALTLRPIRPEDEPRWRALLASCSPEALYARFRYLFQWSTHEAATRYCFIDYDREIAIVAETEDGSGGGRALVGVGRLIADPDNETGEYAVLVTDAFQNRGLGGVLTDTCLEIARSWGIRRVVAETTADNVRMIALFQGRGFEVTAGEQGLVTVAKDLA
ncbi:MAG TPA: GNAT family N-acetyltransferase, partial [Thermoanaerobaculales bacterium]|nr:GNAT family N-acetyltransferase [Thermoanaerobaculales bacterium]